MKKNALLLSSSGYEDSKYLSHCKAWIEEFLDELNLLKQEAIFIPYAGVRISYDEYEKKVKDGLKELNIKSLHHFKDKKQALKDAKIIIVGGGNTFVLLATLVEFELIDIIKNKVLNEQTAYISWSAGSNIAGASIKTTNDMPIINPKSFEALNIFPHQINPHFISGKINAHNGESREERLEEFLMLNPKSQVYALYEGSAIKINDDKAKIIGFHDAIKFSLDKKEIIKRDIEFKY